MDPVSLYNYVRYVISVRMLSWVEVFVEMFAITLSVVCSCAEVPGDPPQRGLPRNGGIRKETTFLKKVCVKAEGGESYQPRLRCLLSSCLWDLTFGDLREADFCFWAGEVKPESWKRQKYVFIHCMVNAQQGLCY